MLNGKELRHCTFAEVATFGERYAKLASMGELDQIVEPPQRDVPKSLFGGKLMPSAGIHSDHRLCGLSTLVSRARAHLRACKDDQGGGRQ